MLRVGREPRDIDVVSFIRLPTEGTRADLSQFVGEAAKSQYRVDSYFVDVDTGNMAYLLRRIAYWNGLWSHSRQSEWKGYVEIDLSDSEDAEARAALEAAMKWEEQDERA